IFMTAPGDIAVQGSIVLRSSEPLDNGQLSLTSDSGSVTLGKTIHMVGRGEGGQVLASAGKDITINGSIAARSGPFYSRAGIVQLFANGLVDVTARKIDISARPGAYSSSSDGLNISACAVVLASKVITGPTVTNEIAYTDKLDLSGA